MRFGNSIGLIRGSIDTMFLIEATGLRTRGNGCRYDGLLVLSFCIIFYFYFLLGFLHTSLVATLNHIPQI